MRRHVREGGETLNERLTDAMIEEANKFVSEDMDGRIDKEDMERFCDILGSRWPNQFSIHCRTKYDYRSFIFKLHDDGVVELISVEGDYRS